MSRTCSRCLYNETVPNISFDEQGVCNFCHEHDRLDQLYPTGEEGLRRLRREADKIRREGRGKEFDCVVGISGGCDSSYLLYVVKEIMKLRPLAVHYDNSFNGDIATQNIEKVTGALEVPVETWKVDPEEYADYCRAFLRAGVPNIDAHTDMALLAVINGAAARHGVRYAVDGHNFRTEGSAPMLWTYMDGRFVEGIHRLFGTRPLKTYPTARLGRQMYWMLVKRIQRVRPLYHLAYVKEDVKRFLADNFGWRWYGGHHLESRYTAFVISYYYYQRFGIDARLLGHSALVRSGKMDRREALEELAEAPTPAEGLVEDILARLGLSPGELENFLKAPKKYYYDYPTDKKTFERFRPFFWLMAKLGLMPMSFYLKYTVREDRVAAS